MTRLNGNVWSNAAGNIPQVRALTNVTEYLRIVYGASSRAQHETVHDALAPIFSPEASVPNVWWALMLYESLLLACCPGWSAPS